MQKLLINTRDNLKEIRNIVENCNLPENKYPLNTFREEPGIISDLIKDLTDTIKVSKKD